MSDRGRTIWQVVSAPKKAPLSEKKAAACCCFPSNTSLVWCRILLTYVHYDWQNKQAQEREAKGEKTGETTEPRGCGTTVHSSWFQKSTSSAQHSASDLLTCDQYTCRFFSAFAVASRTWLSIAGHLQDLLQYIFLVRVQGISGELNIKFHPQLAELSWG